ncbi:HD-GYP domain-containing protein [Paenibacillus sp. J2TS4]|uniref:HD-GYP domain-containing protein n=1 Tax=Paenibacillus sp. J2TS4 TaxID=2807194 RepID=UPI001B1CF21E|nr:HD-GYP domain-containing protein [Paenibacillus sp. J2TS4]GIP36036.1 HD family phosphohydrolase [Paenibacillus sp. J2TS4]
MTKVSVELIKDGDYLAEDVFTSRGSLLMEKGRVLTLREKQVLKAFLIFEVSLVSDKTESASSHTEEGVRPSLALKAFQAEYNDLLEFVRKLFQTAEAGGMLPILEVRSRLETVLQHIDQYHPMTANYPTPIFEYLFHHSIRVSLSSYLLAKWHGISEKDHLPIALAGLLHDIGSVRVDHRLLDKEASLMNQEMEAVKKHTVFGYQILKQVSGLNEGTKLATLQHHEKENGSGYPLGIKGEQIHPYSKIVAIVDTFHAMTSDRNHKKGISPYLVLEHIFNESFGKLDPELVQTFIHRVTSFHTGTKVILSDKRVGEIVFTDRAQPTRPWIKIDGDIVNLALVRSISIQEVLSE